MEQGSTVGSENGDKVTRPRVAVIGAGSPDNELYGLARELGRGLARLGVEVVCGGLGGVMEGVCRGARKEGGTTIGILPGHEREAANPWIQLSIATGLGHARNQMVALNGDVVVAVGGAYGTLTELGFAKIYGKPVIAISSWEVEGITTARDVDEALAQVTLTFDELGVQLPFKPPEPEGG